jgi:hypothetical protein
MFIVCLTTYFTAEQTFAVGTAIATPGQRALGAIEVPAGRDAAASIPVAVFRGAKPGPVLALILEFRGLCCCHQTFDCQFCDGSIKKKFASHAAILTADAAERMGTDVMKQPFPNETHRARCGSFSRPPALPLSWCVLLLAVLFEVPLRAVPDACVHFFVPTEAFEVLPHAVPSLAN